MPTPADTPNASASDHQVIAAGTGDSAADQQGGADAQGHPDHPADRGQQHGLEQELHADVAGPGADRLAQADLPGPLAHRDQHDVGDADAADEQGDPGDRGEHAGEHAEDVAEYAEDLLLGDRAELGVRVALQLGDDPVAELVDRVPVGRLDRQAVDPVGAEAAAARR